MRLFGEVSTHNLGLLGLWLGTAIRSRVCACVVCVRVCDRESVCERNCVCVRERERGTGKGEQKERRGSDREGGEANRGEANKILNENVVRM